MDEQKVVVQDEKPTDWKAELAVLKQKLKDLDAWFDAEYKKLKAQYDVKRDDVVAQMKKTLEYAGNDFMKWWESFKLFWKEFGKKINWSKYWAIYTAILLIGFGLILHYVFGV